MDKKVLERRERALFARVKEIEGKIVNLTDDWRREMANLDLVRLKLHDLEKVEETTEGKETL
jgi:hypothetical protein